MTDYRASLKVEYAAKVHQCTKCGDPIPERELCFAYLIETDTNGESRERIHCNCFLEDDGNISTSPAEIKNFVKVRYEDQKRIEEMIIKTNSSKYRVTKIENFCSLCGESISEETERIYAEAWNSEASTQFHVDCYTRHLQDTPWRQLARNQVAAGNKSSATEIALKRQNDRVYNLQKDLETGMSLEEMREVFEHNDLRVPEGKSRRIERLAEAVVFGVAPTCPQCKRRALRLRNGTYQCQTIFSAYACCDYTPSYDPRRSKLRIPEKLLQRFPFLDAPMEERVLSGFGEGGGAVQYTLEVRKIRQFFRGKRIVVEGTTKDAELVRKKLLRLGCKIERGVTGETLCLISTEDCIKHTTKQVQEARVAGVIVLSRDILNQIDGKVPYKPELCKISIWGETAKLNFRGSPDLMSTEPTRRYDGSNISTHFPVDPQCSFGNWASAEVCQHGGTVYSCVLGETDLSRGINSHCRLQLLKSGLYFIVFHSISVAPDKSQSWERRETTHLTFESAFKDFQTQFSKLTGNSWQPSKKVVKLPGKFDVVKTGFVQNESLPSTSDDKPSAWYREVRQTMAKSQPPPAKAVRDLIDVIVALSDGWVTIDFRENPLGVISADQLTKAYETLAELRSLIENGKPSHMQILHGSNKFYTVIPQSFDASSPPPLLDNLEILKVKQDTLDRWARRWVSRRVPGYPSLGTEIEVLSKDGKEFSLISEHCRTLCAAVQGLDTLEVLDVFSIKREGEAERFKPHRWSYNRKLLWHRSAPRHCASILRDGLQSGLTPGRFGRALYFADFVFQLTAYRDVCADTMYLLLCEVALGNVHESTTIITQPPAGKDSIKELGKNFLDREEELDGCPLAMGPVTVRSTSLDLDFNEYVIYDAARVRIKYLVKLRRLPRC